MTTGLPLFQARVSGFYRPIPYKSLAVPPGRPHPPSLAPLGTMAPRRSARLSARSDGREAEAASPEAMPPPPPEANPRKRKAPARSGAAGAAELAAPTTPQKRRAPRAATPPPPATPTPSAVGLMAEAARGAAGAAAPPKPRPRAVNRLADPRGTNAPLLSPSTSRLVARPPAEAVSPSKAGAAETTTTTGNILEEACRHLIRVDPRMKPLIDAHHCRVFSPEGLAEEIDPFESLTSGIISQQVSGAAARAIKARFVALFDDDAGAGAGEAADGEPSSQGARTKRGFPAPARVAATPLDRLRTAGLSQRKAEYVQGLAAKFASGELSARLLADAPYDEVLGRLTAVRGLGRWSVEMFACFGLKRLDVFSLGDLGVQRGMAAFVGRDVAKLKAKGGKWKYMSEADMESLAARFAPYRSVFMWYMWRVEETDISTLE